MGEKSNIEWTDSTFNPFLGCTKVSPGCQNCYAEELMDFRYGKVKWGKGKPRVRTSVSNWNQPLKWNEQSGGLFPRRHKVFCASLCDWLDDEVPIEWLADLLTLIHNTPNLDWQLLSKRPENWRRLVSKAVPHMRDKAKIWLISWIMGVLIPENIWMGTSVETQEMADRRIPMLLKIPAMIKFLSVEPLLSPVELDLIAIDWVIVGGESGPRKRPFDCDWARDIRDQCAAADVPYFFKQVDKVQPIPPDLMIQEFPVLRVQSSATLDALVRVGQGSLLTN